MKFFLLVVLAAIAVGDTGISKGKKYTIDRLQKNGARNQLWQRIVESSSLGARSGGKRPPIKYIHAPTGAKLPKSFNPIDKWPKCESLREIRDQSACGSCWAFAAVEAASDRLCIHSNGTHQERLSAADMLSCCTECGHGCDGGFPAYAWEWMHTDGIVTGDLYGDKKYCYPYPFPECTHAGKGTHSPCKGNRPTPNCKTTCQNGYPVAYKQDKHFFNQAYGIPKDEEAIMWELQHNGPIEVYFTVYDDFMTYDHGIYHHITGGYSGGHAVKLMGWGEEAGVKYWTVANSWNEDWGEKGYFRILRGVNECGIESQGVAGLPKL